MEKIEGTYVKEKETPGTFRYLAEDTESNPIKTIYIRKWALGSPPPEKIRLVVEEA